MDPGSGLLELLVKSFHFFIHSRDKAENHFPSEGAFFSLRLTSFFSKSLVSTSMISTTF